MIAPLKNLALWGPIAAVLMLAASSHLALAASGPGLAALWALLLWMLFSPLKPARILSAAAAISVFALARLAAHGLAADALASALVQIGGTALVFALFPYPETRRFPDARTAVFLALAWGASRLIVP